MRGNRSFSDRLPTGIGYPSDDLHRRNHPQRPLTVFSAHASAPPRWRGDLPCDYDLPPMEEQQTSRRGEYRPGTVVSVRFGPADRQALEQAAQARGLSLAGLIRRAALAHASAASTSDRLAQEARDSLRLAEHRDAEAARRRARSDLRRSRLDAIIG